LPTEDRRRGVYADDHFAALDDLVDRLCEGGPPGCDNAERQEHGPQRLYQPFHDLLPGLATKRVALH